MNVLYSEMNDVRMVQIRSLRGDRLVTLLYLLNNSFIRCNEGASDQAV